MTIKTIEYEKALQLGPRRFVREYLFPAMRRQHGNGFAMQSWWHRIEGRGCQTTFYADGVRRPIPSCGTVACIGGAAAMVTDFLSYNMGITPIAKLFGISQEMAGVLFYDWVGNRGPWAKLSRAFEAAETPSAKERIAEKAVLAAIRIGERERKTA